VVEATGGSRPKTDDRAAKSHVGVIRDFDASSTVQPFGVCAFDNLGAP
jgi:hypothetical protein